MLEDFRTAAHEAHAISALKSAAKSGGKLPEAIGSSEVKSKLEQMNTTDMLSTIDAILPGIRSAAPTAKPDQITNALTAAYCPIAMQKAEGSQRSIVLGSFATLVYGQAAKNGKSN